MEWINFEKIVQYFFEFGPFAILAFIMIFALPRLYKKLENAKGDLKRILKRHILIYQSALALLIIFCVGYWVIQINGITYYSGEILHLNPAEHRIESRNLHLRRYSVGTDYIIDWIWEKRKDDKSADIKIIAKDPVTGRDIKKEFEFYPTQLKRGEKCTFTYSENDGTLMHNKAPLNIVHGLNLPTMEKDVIYSASICLLYALPQEVSGLNIAKILNLLQAFDSDTRDQAVELVIQSPDKDKSIVIDLLRQGFGILYQKTQGVGEQQPRLYNRTYLFTSLLDIIEGLSQKWKIGYNEWKTSLGDKAVDLIVEEAGSSDPNLHVPSLRFLSKFQNEVVADLENKLNRTQYQKKGEYIKGVFQFYSRLSAQKGQEEYSRKLLDRSKFVDKVTVIEPFFKSTSQSISFDKPPENISEKKKLVIKIAWELKEKNIYFKWGGKSPDKGFDSSGFIAYIFDKVGLLEKPEKWWSGKLRDQMGKPAANKTPQEIGDLVFYKGGYVMLYLGDNKIIGMTVGGIIIQDYREFPAELVQVNSVDYDRKIR